MPHLMYMFLQITVNWHLVLYVNYLHLVTCLEVVLCCLLLRATLCRINTKIRNMWCYRVHIMSTMCWTAAQNSRKSQQLSWRSWHTSKVLHETSHTSVVKHCMACCLASSPTSTYTKSVSYCTQKTEEGDKQNSACVCACQRTTTWLKWLSLAFMYIQHICFCNKVVLLITFYFLITDHKSEHFWKNLPFSTNSISFTEYVWYGCLRKPYKMSLWLNCKKKNQQKLQWTGF